MSIPMAMLTGLLMGAVFGFLLEKSRVFEPGVILGQMQMRNFLMLRIFLSAVAAGLVIVAVLVVGGLSGIHPKPTLYGADIIGGLLLGAGIAMAGACPGTVMVQIGVGYRDAIITLLGGLSGVAAFLILEPVLKPVLLSGGPGKLTLDRVTGLPFWAVALVLAGLLIGGLMALERWRPWRDDLGADGDGLLPPTPAPAPIAPARGVQAG